MFKFYFIFLAGRFKKKKGNLKKKNMKSLFYDSIIQITCVLETPSAQLVRANALNTHDTFSKA